jgi:hypothetical protein
LALCFFSPSVAAGTLTGAVHNGTNGKPGAGLDVILFQLQGGMEPIASTKTDSQGHFRIDNASVGTAPMLLRVVYRGVKYHEPVTPGKTTLDVQVFDPTDKPSAITVAIHVIILQPHSSVLLVGEEYTVENKTQPPLVYYREDGSFFFSLPGGAQLKDVSAVGSAGMPTTQGTIDKGKNQKAIAYAFRPGETGVRISYELPYPGDQANLHFTSPYAADRLAIFAPPSVQISADGFAPAGQDQGFSVYMRESVARNAPFSVSMSGTAPIQSSGQGRTLSAAPGGDDAQNRSVNSRSDTGSEASAATVTTMPARLDSLKWILVIGLAAIFALGFLFLWRRPRMLEASVSTGDVSEASAHPQFSSVASAKAAADAEASREVGRSLDELKDNLFRLELRRQAGTINEGDYSCERQRIEQLLRDLVRG